MLDVLHTFNCATIIFSSRLFICRCFVSEVLGFISRCSRNMFSVLSLYRSVLSSSSCFVVSIHSVMLYGVCIFVSESVFTCERHEKLVPVEMLPILLQSERKDNQVSVTLVREMACHLIVKTLQRHCIVKITHWESCGWL
jgi:hypothetical protein